MSVSLHVHSLGRVFKTKKKIVKCLDLIVTVGMKGTVHVRIINVTF